MRGDFEAIAVVGRQVILTTSDGVLYAGREGRDGESVPYVTQATGVGRDCEIEGMAYEAAGRALLFACKVPRTRALVGHLAVLRWSLDRKALDPRPWIFVRLVRHHRGTSTARRFIHRSCSGSRAAATTWCCPAHAARDRGDHRGRQASWRWAGFAARDHRQAEGLAFAADGALLISDEGAGRRGTVTVYRRR